MKEVVDILQPQHEKSFLPHYTTRRTRIERPIGFPNSTVHFGFRRPVAFDTVARREERREDSAKPRNPIQTCEVANCRIPHALTSHVLPCETGTGKCSTNETLPLTPVRDGRTRKGVWGCVGGIINGFSILLILCERLILLFGRSGFC